jgi:hypothetical protein
MSRNAPVDIESTATIMPTTAIMPKTITVDAPQRPVMARRFIKLMTTVCLRKAMC